MGTKAVVGALVALAVAACSADNGPTKEELQDRIAALEEQKAALEEQLRDAQAKAEQAQSAASSLSAAVGRLRDEDPIFAGPAVQGAATDVESAVGETKSALDGY